MRVFFSPNFDPYYHLALEHYFLYQDLDVENDPVFLVYRNNPSVVFGNFQNPWIECHIPYCLKNKINLVRRFSGGGCVYHDKGNLNFCLISKKENKSKELLISLLINFLKTLGLNAQRGEKSDVLIDKNKISGSAFRETKERTLHHCTLLIDSDLRNLEQVLNSPLGTLSITTKALPSRRASVMNIAEAIDIDAVKLLKKLEYYLKEKGFELQDLPIYLSIEEFKFDQWYAKTHIFGKTPLFEITHKELRLVLKDACLQSVVFGFNQKKIEKSIFSKEIFFPLKKNQLQNILEIPADYYLWLEEIGLLG